MLGNDKLGMAVGGRGQLHIKGAALQGRAGITQPQRQLGTCVAGPIVADDVAEGYHMGRLYFPHALAPAFSLQAVVHHGIHQAWLPLFLGLLITAPRLSAKHHSAAIGVQHTVNIAYIS